MAIDRRRRAQSTVNSATHHATNCRKQYVHVYKIQSAVAITNFPAHESIIPKAIFSIFTIA